MTDTYTLHGARNGIGTTTAAVLSATHLAANGGTVALLDMAGGDTSRMTMNSSELGVVSRLGMPQPVHPAPDTPVTFLTPRTEATTEERCNLIRGLAQMSEFDYLVIDAGTARNDRGKINSEVDTAVQVGRSIMVTTNCLLTLRRGRSLARYVRVDQVLLINQSDRATRADTVVEQIGAPCRSWILWSRAIAYMSDSRTLGHGVPDDSLVNFGPLTI